MVLNSDCKRNKPDSVPNCFFCFINYWLMVTSNKDFKMVKVSFKEIYTKFKVWAHDNGENEMSGKALGGSLIEREFIPKGISGQRFYVGLSLRKDEEPNNS